MITFCYDPSNPKAIPTNKVDSVIFELKLLNSFHKPTNNKLHDEKDKYNLLSSVVLPL